MSRDIPGKRSMEAWARMETNNEENIVPPHHWIGPMIGAEMIVVGSGVPR